ncbi:hypothetical protein [Dysgonomonas sp. 511]|uniref:hypothetical protein n=1 Tax=Dysgonomonas sp. 511 TaxID=2302930 RepID=UPI0013D7E2CE|nr:hypothetical protein [Dysgonomonas sp. 511]NDV79777.1 hypothetical protein [Dysgonomonas sp. 511]
MKRNRILSRIFCFLFVSAILVSCSTVDDGIKKTQLGMTKQQVVKVMGDNYQIKAMTQTSEGALEIWRYTMYVLDSSRQQTTARSYYLLHFLNGKLVEMYQEDAQPDIIIQSPHQRPPHRGRS